MNRLTGEAQSRLITFTLGLIALVAVATFAAVLYLLATGARDASVRAAQTNTDIASCRALARLPIDEARTNIETLILEYGSAAATPNRDDDLAVFTRATDARAQLDQATAGYRAALVTSARDPQRFLEDCAATMKELTP